MRTLREFFYPRDFFLHSCVEKASYRVVDVKSHAKNAKTPSFFSAQRVREYLFLYRLYILNIFASLRTLREFFCPRDLFQHSCVEKASYRVFNVLNLTQRTQRRKVFLVREELENIFFCRDFILLQTLRLCALCEKFFSPRDLARISFI